MSNEFGGGDGKKTLFGAPRPEGGKDNKWAKLSKEDLDIFQILLDFHQNPQLNGPSEENKAITEVLYPDLNKIKEIMKAHGLTLSDLPREIYMALVDLEMLFELEDEPIRPVKEPAKVPSLRGGESVGIISMHDPRPTMVLERDNRREIFSTMLEEARKYLNGEKEGTFEEITVLADSIVQMAKSFGMTLKEVLGEDTEFIDFILTNARSTGGVGTVDVKNMYPETVIVDRTALEAELNASPATKIEKNLVEDNLEDLIPRTPLQRIAHAFGSLFKPKKKK